MVQAVKKNEEPHYIYYMYGYFFPELHTYMSRYTCTNIVPVHPDTGRSYLLKPLPDENNLGTRSSLAIGRERWGLARKGSVPPPKNLSFLALKASIN